MQKFVVKVKRECTVGNYIYEIFPSMDFTSVVLKVFERCVEGGKFDCIGEMVLPGIAAEDIAQSIAKCGAECTEELRQMKSDAPAMIAKYKTFLDKNE